MVEQVAAVIVVEVRMAVGEVEIIPLLVLLKENVVEMQIQQPLPLPIEQAAVAVGLQSMELREQIQQVDPVVQEQQQVLTEVQQQGLVEEEVVVVVPVLLVQLDLVVEEQEVQPEIHLQVLLPDVNPQAQMEQIIQVEELAVAAEVLVVLVVVV